MKPSQLAQDLGSNLLYHETSALDHPFAHAEVPEHSGGMSGNVTRVVISTQSYLLTH